MAQCLLNTLYVQHPDAHVRLEGETLRVDVEDFHLLQVPLHHLGAVVLFGTATITSGAMQQCAKDGREVTFLDFSGRFRCRVEGPTQGNVLLRVAQFDAYRDPARSLALTRRFAAGKLRNARQVLLRGAREAADPAARQALTAAAAEQARALAGIPQVATLDDLRGLEGHAAAGYFAAFGRLITSETTEFAFTLRTRRPPRDRVNALLSFLYALLAGDCTAAVTGVGLDPQLGFLHAVRSGRPALALDVMEEFRPCLADRLALTLINRRQLRPEHFDVRAQAGESVLLNENGRKIVLAAYQQRKAEPVKHHLLKTDVPFGLVPHLQARLLARFLRGDVAHYQPYLSS